MEDQNQELTAIVQVQTMDGRIVNMPVPISQIEEPDEPLLSRDQRTISKAELQEVFPDMTDENIQHFYGHIPTKFTRRMVEYLPVFMLSKIYGEPVTYKKALSMVEQVKADAPFESPAEEEKARMYAKYIEDFGEKTLDKFTWKHVPPYRIVHAKRLAAKAPFNDDDKEYRERLKRNLSTKGSYGAREDGAKVISVALPPELYPMIQLARHSFKNNLTAYVNAVLRRDILQHWNIYDDIAREVLGEDYGADLLEKGLMDEEYCQLEAGRAKYDEYIKKYGAAPMTIAEAVKKIRDTELKYM